MIILVRMPPRLWVTKAIGLSPMPAPANSSKNVSSALEHIHFPFRPLFENAGGISEGVNRDPFQIGFKPERPETVVGLIAPRIA